MTRAHWIELLLVTLAAMAAVAAIPLVAGEWGWSWDALNHHVYLGLISETPRWHLDATPASVQTWQYPYLYWPVYRLLQLPLDGAVAGALWGGLLALLLVPPLWVIGWRLLPEQGSRAQGAFERIAATTLGLSSVVVLTSLNTTANDPLASVPLMWALALMCAPSPSDRRAAVAAALWGASVAFKLSNVLALPLMFVWWWRRPGWPLPLRRAAVMAACAALGFGLCHLPWGWQLWAQTGNPIHPFLPQWFGR